MKRIGISPGSRKLQRRASVIKPVSAEPMRRCGKQYGSEAEALRSKAGQRPGAEVASCRCGMFHLSLPAESRSDGTPRRSGGGNTIPASVCAQVDMRDGRQCLNCGAAERTHRHHRRIKGHGGDTRPHTDCACNIITLCSVCHFWAHVLDVVTAKAKGFIISRSETRPWTQPVMVRTEEESDSGLAAWPTCSGGWVFEEPKDVAA